MKLLLKVLLPVMALLAACSDDGETNVTAPDFSLPSATGETVSLDDYAGRPVLLYFHMAVG